MFLKLEKYIFYFFLFAIPFQTRKILWYSGWRFNEWTSVSVYGTDILLAILFVLWAFNHFSTLSNYELPASPAGRRITNYGKNLKSQFQNPIFYLFLFIFISAVSIKNSNNILISWFQWLKLVELAVFYLYLSRYALAKFGLKSTFIVLILSGFFQAIIATIQIFMQSSIGFRYLGESVINSELPGVASFYLPAQGGLLTGEKIIRAYGTFPHPNVLASFLFLTLFAFYFIYFYSRLDSKTFSLPDSSDKYLLAVYCVLLFGYFSTFSRVVIFIWFISFCARTIIIRIFRHYRLVFGTPEGRKKIKVILLTSLVVIIVFGIMFFSESTARISIDKSDQAVELRSFYVEKAFSEINLFGTGIGNFVGWLMIKEPFLLPFTYQPVHNIYLLIFSETGILGLTAFILFIAFVIKDFILNTRLKASYHLSLLIFFCSILFIGFFDHLFFTLQQGRLIFWLVLALFSEPLLFNKLKV